MELTQYRADPRSYAPDPEGSAAALDAMQYMIPGWGDGKSAVDVYHDLQSGDMDAAKLDAALFGLGLIPVVGDVGTGLLKGMAKSGKMIAPTAKAATASTRGSISAIQQAYDLIRKNWDDAMLAGDRLGHKKSSFLPYAPAEYLTAGRQQVAEELARDIPGQVIRDVDNFWPIENPSRWGSTTAKQRTIAADQAADAMPYFHGRPSTRDFYANYGQRGRRIPDDEIGDIVRPGWSPEASSSQYRLHGE